MTGRTALSGRRGEARSGAALIVTLLISVATVLQDQPASGSVDGRSFAFQAGAVGHDWANAYLLALLSHDMYPSSLDATVDPSAGPTTEDTFRAAVRGARQQPRPDVRGVHPQRDHRH